jgi:hypothetical protein
VSSDHHVPLYLRDDMTRASGETAAFPLVDPGDGRSRCGYRADLSFFCATRLQPRLADSGLARVSRFASSMTAFAGHRRAAIRVSARLLSTELLADKGLAFLSTGRCRMALLLG